MAPSITSTLISTFLMSHGTLLILELRQTNADLKSANKVLVLIHEMVLAYCSRFWWQSAVLNDYDTIYCGYRSLYDTASGWQILISKNADRWRSQNVREWISNIASWALLATSLHTILRNSASRSLAHFSVKPPRLQIIEWSTVKASPAAHEEAISSTGR